MMMMMMLDQQMMMNSLYQLNDLTRDDNARSDDDITITNGCCEFVS